MQPRLSLPPVMSPVCELLIQLAKEFLKGRSHLLVLLHLTHSTGFGTQHRAASQVGGGRKEHLGHCLAFTSLLSTTCPQICPALLTYPQGQDAHSFPRAAHSLWAQYARLPGLASFLDPGSLSFLSRARLAHGGSVVLGTHPGQREGRD